MYVRFNNNNRTNEGYLDGDKVYLLTAPMMGGGVVVKESVELSNVKLLAPCEPSKVVCVGPVIPGDSMIVTIESVGSLTNQVVAG